MTIQLDTLSYAYPGTPQTLSAISLRIEQGECIALTGHNGSGKTTLVKHLNGLLIPDSGDVWINNTNTRLARTTQLAGQVALLFQNPDDQICKQRVIDEVAFGPKNLGFTGQKIDRLVCEALTLFDLMQYKDYNPHDLGYSERKRTALASIVAMDTSILVFDEPTAGLDRFEIDLLRHCLDILRQDRKTVIIISHDVDFIAENMKRAVSLAHGRKIFDGTVRNLFQQDAILEQCGLRQPQMVQLSKHCGLTSTALSPQEFLSFYEEEILLTVKSDTSLPQQSRNPPRQDSTQADIKQISTDP